MTAQRNAATAALCSPLKQRTDIMPHAPIRCTSTAGAAYRWEIKDGNGARWTPCYGIKDGRAGQCRGCYRWETGNWDARLAMIPASTKIKNYRAAHLRAEFAWLEKQ